jgi:D-3-phosphoglycerate dehydrogenase
MPYKILLTSTSFQDTPGAHHDLLNAQGFEMTFLRGPLKESELLHIIAKYDGIICGDDDITEQVIANGKNGKLRIISKYGIGLDKINLPAAEKYNIPVTNCPGVNQVTVAEHVFALLLSYVKNIIPENDLIKNQQWKRLTGTELFGKTIGIIGLGNIGKEVAIRASAFGLNIIAFDKYADEIFSAKYKVEYQDTINDLLKKSDVISLNLSLNSDSKHIINSENLTNLKNGVVVVNTARAGLIEQAAVIEGIENGKIGAYLTDVLEEEPMVKDHPFLKYDNIIITPHIGSRTYESVVRQGTMAVENLLKYIHN